MMLNEVRAGGSRENDVFFIRVPRVERYASVSRPLAPRIYKVAARSVVLALAFEVLACSSGPRTEVITAPTLGANRHWVAMPSATPQPTPSQ